MRTASWVVLELLLSAALLSGSVGAVLIALDVPQTIARPCATDTIECVRERIRGMSGQLFPQTGPRIEGDTIALGPGAVIWMTRCAPTEVLARRYAISGGTLVKVFGCSEEAF